MAVLATFDENGFPTGFYPEPVWTAKTAPQGAIEITDAQYGDFCQNPGARRMQGMSVVAFAPVFQPTIPDVISSRQFFTQLAIQGKITQDEALSFACNGTLPASLAALLEQIPMDQQFVAKMAVIGGRVYSLSNSLTKQIATLYGMSDADLRSFWLAASLI